MKVTSGRILALIRDGLYPSQIARKLRVSHVAVLKRLAVLEREGRIKRISLFPALYEILGPIRKRGLQVFMGDGDCNFSTKNNPLRVVEPHHFGEWFKVVRGKLSGGDSWRPRGNLVCRRWKSGEFTVLGYSGGKTEKVVFWLKRFKGFSPQEQVVAGRTTIRQEAERFGKEHGLRLEFLKPAGLREWNTTTIGGGLSEEVIKGLDLRKANKQVGDVVFSTDKSHPGTAEFKAVDELVGKAPDEYARRFHSLVKDEAQVNLPKQVAELEKRFNQSLETNLEGIGVLVERIKRLEGTAQPPVSTVEKKDGPRPEVF